MREQKRSTAKHVGLALKEGVMDARKRGTDKKSKLKEKETYGTYNKERATKLLKWH